MSYNQTRAPLQWQDLDVFTEEGTEVAIRVQYAVGDYGPQYSLSIGRVYQDRFGSYFRNTIPQGCGEVIDRLNAQAADYIADHKAKNGGGSVRRDNDRGGRREHNEDDWGRKGGKRARA